MANCTKCGAQIDDNASVCPSCGAQQNTAANSVNATFSAVNSLGDDLTGQFDRNDIEANKGMAILSYIFILWLVPLLAAPNSKYARFHANQGLVLFILECSLGVIVFLVGLAMGLLGTVGGIVSWIVWAVVLIIDLCFAIIGILNAVNGTAKQLPVIGAISLIK